SPRPSRETGHAVRPDARLAHRNNSRILRAFDCPLVQASLTTAPRILTVAARTLCKDARIGMIPAFCELSVARCAGVVDDGPAHSTVAASTLVWVRTTGATVGARVGRTVEGHASHASRDRQGGWVVMPHLRGPFGHGVGKGSLRGSLRPLLIAALATLGMT